MAVLIGFALVAGVLGIGGGAGILVYKYNVQKIELQHQLAEAKHNDNIVNGS